MLRRSSRGTLRHPNGRKVRSNKGKTRGKYRSRKHSNNVFPDFMQLGMPNNARQIKPLYTTNSKVNKSKKNYKEITPKKFMAKVKNNKKMLAIAFYAPWCGHCKDLLPEWSKAAKQLKKDNIELGIVNSSNSDHATQALNTRYGVNGFPTIKVFKPKCNGEGMDYEGGRNSLEIVKALKSLKKRKQTGGSLQNNGSLQNSEHNYVELTPKEFMNNVTNNKKMMATAFYAPSCGHCTNLLPNWDSAAKELENDDIELSIVDASNSDEDTQTISGNYGINGYPTIKVFKSNCGGESTEYEGGRSHEDIVNTLREINSQ